MFIFQRSLQKKVRMLIMMWGYGYMWPMMIGGIIGMTLWIVVLAAIIWAVVRWLNHRTAAPTWQQPTPPASGPTALEILRQRYARGEIDAATFEQMRERLEASGPSGTYEHQPTMPH
jgi:putative membrane protein